jgi:hypothetical protein
MPPAIPPSCTDLQNAMEFPYCRELHREMELSSTQESTVPVGSVSLGQRCRSVEACRGHNIKDSARTMPRILDSAPHISDIEAGHAAQRASPKAPSLPPPENSPPGHLRSAGQVFALYRFDDGEDNKAALKASGLHGQLLALAVGDVVQVHHKVRACCTTHICCPLSHEPFLASLKRTVSCTSRAAPRISSLSYVKD